MANENRQPAVNIKFQDRDRYRRLKEVKENRAWTWKTALIAGLEKNDDL